MHSVCDVSNVPVLTTVLLLPGEMLRKAFVGGRSLPASHQQCLPTACIEIASRVCKRPVNRDLLFRISKQNEKSYLFTVKVASCTAFACDVRD